MEYGIDRSRDNLSQMGDGAYRAYDAMTPEMKKIVASACESAYRRGFSQGVWAAYEAAEQGASPTRLNDYFDKVYRWRLRRHKGKHECPPTYTAPKQLNSSKG